MAMKRSNVRALSRNAHLWQMLATTTVATPQAFTSRHNLRMSRLISHGWHLEVISFPPRTITTSGSHLNILSSNSRLGRWALIPPARKTRNNQAPNKQKKTILI
ncbi:hypothetical protein DPMN_086891 [Dreissena polymorpha]|uniref:Uncharacterized protein n=1 Tax=Dreissena polymorpha TaxID=45954 RepID=A0A9D4KSQ3_DREPO|nr:hypothetical protein DPMN_086891 [Dreissena polymorpha]